MHQHRSAGIFLALVLVLSFTVVSPSRPQASGQPDLARRVDSLFAQWDNPGSPGCAVGIIRDGDFIYRRGFGDADIEHGIPNSSQTVFNIGSTSKQFTAACILLLARQHKLSLDDDVRRYIPELPSYGRTITIRQLLSHTSGLRDYITLLYFSGVRVEDLSSSRDALEMIVRQKGLNFPPGTEWSYSNTGFFLASVIVQRVSGELLPAFAKEHIFDPLGMKNTEWVCDAKRIVPNRAVGYSPKTGGGFQLSPSGWDEVGDGGLHTTVDDLLLWDRNFYQPLVGDTGVIRQMTTPGSLKDGSPISYGLGMFVETYRGLSVVRHEGEWAGYRAEMMRFPGQRFTVICLCNLSSMVPTQLARKIADIYLAREMSELEKVASSQPPAPSPLTVTPEELSSFAGYYRNPADESVRRIIVDSGKLLYARVPGAQSALEPVAKSTFRMLGVPVKVEVTFSMGRSGTPTGMRVAVEGDKPITFLPFEPVTLTKDESAEYTGKYYCEELDENYDVALQDSGIVVRIRRFDDLPLTPTVRDIFKYEDYRLFAFQRNRNDRITGFTLTTGRARNLVFTKTSQPGNEPPGG